MIGTYLVYGWMRLFMVHVDYRLFGIGCYRLFGCKSVVQVVTVVYLTVIV